MAEDLMEIRKWENATALRFTNGVIIQPSSETYQEYLADIWVGIVLTLMVLSCVCCMCSCLLYHKFQQWKRSAVEARNSINLEAGPTEVDLPSYTIASGLPTYQEALEQLKMVKEMTKPNQNKMPENNENVPKATSSTPLSVMNLFQLYTKNETITKPS